MKAMAGARLVEGRGLWTAGAETVFFRWHWCPAQGLTSLCLTASGPGVFEAILAPAIDGMRFSDVKFDGVDGKAIGLDAPVLAVAPLNNRARAIQLGGRIDEAVLPWGSPCLGLALLSARGEVTISGLSRPGNGSGSLELQLAGDGGGLSLTGEGVSGSFTVDGTVLKGSLVFNGSLVPESARSMLGSMAQAGGNYRMEVSRRLCPG